jgi:hypothetical protein
MTPIRTRSLYAAALVLAGLAVACGVDDVDDVPVDAGDDSELMGDPCFDLDDESCNAHDACSLTSGFRWEVQSGQCKHRDRQHLCLPFTSGSPGGDVMAVRESGDEVEVYQVADQPHFEGASWMKCSDRPPDERPDACRCYDPNLWNPPDDG